MMGASSSRERDLNRVRLPPLFPRPLDPCAWWRMLAILLHFTNEPGPGRSLAGAAIKTALAGRRRRESRPGRYAQPCIEHRVGTFSCGDAVETELGLSKRTAQSTPV
jgi:hypothetical protein